jgi:hypothetical protein
VRRLLACLIGVAALAACGNPNAQQPVLAPPVASTATTIAPSTAAVPQSLAFSAPRVGGGTINLADYAGKPVLLWFWAPT